MQLHTQGSASANFKCVIDDAQPLSFHSISVGYAHSAELFHARTLQLLDLFDWHLGRACSLHAGVPQCTVFNVELKC